MNFIKLLSIISMIALTGCASISKERKQDAYEKCGKHYVKGQANYERCTEIYASNFNGLVSGMPHPEAKKYNQGLSGSHTGYIISFDKSKLFRLAGSDCNISQQTTIWGHNDPKSNDFENCLITNQSSTIDFLPARDIASAPYRERIRKTLNKPAKNIFITSILSDQGENENFEQNFSMATDPCNTPLNSEDTNREIFINCSFKALNALQESLRQDLTKSRYTHIIILSSGWNTVPSSSVSNYNDLLSNIHKAAEGEEFRPLVIGFTWPSKWQNTRVASYINKVNDPDEIGLIWGNYLLNSIIPQAIEASGQSGIKTVVIGHSFGARLLSTATNAQEFVGQDDSIKMSPDALILMQAAFSAKRFHDTPGFGQTQYLSGLENKAGEILITASDGDKRVKLAIHADKRRGHISSYKSWQNICRRDPNETLEPKDTWKDKFDCRQASSFEGGASAEKGKILYLNMDTDTPFRHSHVWGTEMAKKIWTLIK